MLIRLTRVEGSETQKILVNPLHIQFAEPYQDQNIFDGSIIHMIHQYFHVKENLEEINMKIDFP